jgi:hypothetical protein
MNNGDIMHRIIPQLMDQLDLQVMWQAREHFPISLLSSVTLSIEDALGQEIKKVDQ